MLRPIVGGRERDGDSTFEVLKPFDGSVYEEIVSADAGLIDEAFGLCDEAKGIIGAMTRKERADVLLGVSGRLREEHWAGESKGGRLLLRLQNAKGQQAMADAIGRYLKRIRR